MSESPAPSSRPAWPPTREELERLVSTYTEAGAARVYGVTRSTLRHWTAKYGIRSPVPRGCSRRANLPPPPSSPGSSEASTEARLLALLRSEPLRVEDMADRLDRGPGTVRRLLEVLQERGYHLVQRGDLWELETDPAPAEAPAMLPAPVSGHLRIGIVSDTHLGSKSQQLTYLREVYKRFEDAGAQEVYHLGDMLDGVDVYRGQHGEQFLHTYDEQVDYAIAHYPKTDLRTHVIGGNHDLAGVRRGDADPLRRLAAQRADIDYLGPYSAWPQLGRLLMYLLHPDGAAAYAISYKLQKIVESFEGGRKPHVLVVGHWHQMAYIHTRNVHAFYPGSFQAQTEYERRKALQPQIGAVLLDIQVAEDGSWHEVTPTFYRYFVPREKDY